MSLVMNDLQHVCDSTCVVLLFLHHLQCQKVRASYNILLDIVMIWLKFSHLSVRMSQSVSEKLSGSFLMIGRQRFHLQ